MRVKRRFAKTRPMIRYGHVCKATLRQNQTDDLTTLAPSKRRTHPLQPTGVHAPWLLTLASRLSVPPPDGPTRSPPTLSPTSRSPSTASPTASPTATRTAPLFSAVAVAADATCWRYGSQTTAIANVRPTPLTYGYAEAALAASRHLRRRSGGVFTASASTHDNQVGCLGSVSVALSSAAHCSGHPLLPESTEWSRACLLPWQSYLTTLALRAGSSARVLVPRGAPLGADSNKTHFCVS